MLTEYVHTENNFALANINDGSARLAVPSLRKMTAVYHLLPGRKSIQVLPVFTVRGCLQGAHFAFLSMLYKCITFLGRTLRLMSPIRKGTAPGVYSTKAAGECPASLTKPAFKPFPVEMGEG